MANLKGRPCAAQPAVIEVRMRCPNCKHQGTFDAFAGLADLALADGFVVGQRSCPNPECLAHVFFVTKNNRVVASYPAERIDFDATSIPAAVVAALQEAITCHAEGCFVAAAIMVRKTLEELCRDRGATGANLKDRLKALGAKVVTPQELLDGMDDLRLLGNDAAHIESETYRQVGREELEVAIMFAKEVLKAVYQYSTLLGRLRALKKAP